MPIRPEFRHFYRGASWLAARARILERANNQCEQCWKLNRGAIWVFSSEGAGQFWATVVSARSWIQCLTGERLPKPFATIEAAIAAGRLRPIRVVLTVAHLNHTPGDDRDENLKALCQWCHLHYDQLHHHHTRAERKDAARPLLAGVA